MYIPGEWASLRCLLIQYDYILPYPNANTSQSIRLLSTPLFSIFNVFPLGARLNLYWYVCPVVKEMFFRHGFCGVGLPMETSKTCSPVNKARRCRLWWQLLRICFILWSCYVNAEARRQHRRRRPNKQVSPTSSVSTYSCRHYGHCWCPCWCRAPWGSSGHSQQRHTRMSLLRTRRRCFQCSSEQLSLTIVLICIHYSGKCHGAELIGTTCVTIQS